PRDLETICLKCLRKEPHKRYARALDLAEDLRRLLAGEPIQARRAGLVERTWRLARRKPGWAAAIVVAALALVVAGCSYLFIANQHRQLEETIREKEREADMARRLVRFLESLFEVSDPIGVKGHGFRTSR